MRIAIVTDYYYPQLGGITEHVHGQATQLAARGHEVTVVTGRLLHTPAVVDGDGRLTGIATDRDLLKRVRDAGADARRGRLAAVMTRDPEALRPDDRICYAVNRMTAMRCRTVPVVDEDRHPIGIVTIEDITQWLAALFPEATLNLRPGDRLKQPSERDGG